ncbi:MAG: hypothetical protein WB626_00800 [Bacteroidota bacterium]
MKPRKQKTAGEGYRLRMYPRRDPSRSRRTTVFILETVRTFASFPYELSVQETVEAASISFAVRGLQAPRLSLPGPGRARYVSEHEGLTGTYEVSVEGMDGRRARCAIIIGGDAVRVMRRPEDGRLELFTEPEEGSRP